MDAKLSEDQFDQIVQLSFPTYMLKMNTICLDRCSIDLTTADGGMDRQSSLPSSTKSTPTVAQPQLKKSDELLYLSDREAMCIEACSRLYLRQTHTIIDVFKDKLTFKYDV